MIPRARSGRAAVVCSLLLAPLFAQTPPYKPVSLRIIVVNSLSEAQKVRDQLKAGADFAELARKISTDATAADGGAMGTVGPGGAALGNS